MKQPLDHLRSKKKPVRKTVWIAGDSELAEELSELEASLTRAISSHDAMRQDNPRVEAALRLIETLESEVAEKKQKVRESSIKFVFESIGSKAYDKLSADHPPTEDQLKAAVDAGEDKPPFNTDSYPVALITASTIEPDMDKEELAEWLDGPDWNGFELLTMFMACNEVNNSRKIINLGKDLTTTSNTG